MRLAELSQRTDIPRSTIKFYIREGILASGESRGRNQAIYGPKHVERLELIRALREVAGLPVDVVGRVTRELERLREEVCEFLRALPWTADDERHFFADEIAATLLQVRRYLYPDYPVASLTRHAEIAWLLSEAEWALAPGGAPAPIQSRGDDLAEPMRRAILGSVLFERIFAALRRSANAMRAIRIASGLEVPSSGSQPRARAHRKNAVSESPRGAKRKPAKCARRSRS